VSAGGMNALPVVLSPLPPDFPLPVVVVHHVSPDSNNSYFISSLDERIQLKVKEADEKEPIMRGYVYIAPVNYHLLVEDDETFSLSVDAKVNYSRPSIDVLFESAVEVYKSKLIGIILTGANNDGAKGLKKINQHDGLAIVQDPKEAESDAMPRAALAACKADYVLSLEEIAGFLKELSNNKLNKS
ncbi:MAG: chemotaxis protein CheB, partial [Desulfobacterales bacterium]